MRSRWHRYARSMVFRVEITEEAESDAHGILDWLILELVGDTACGFRCFWPLRP